MRPIYLALNILLISGTGAFAQQAVGQSGKAGQKQGVSAVIAVNLPKAFAQADRQTLLMLKEIEKVKADAKKTDLVTPRTLENGKLKLVASKDWTSGFFPGELWFLYEYSGNKMWLEQARKFTAMIEQEQFNGKTHDMGFKVFCSVGTGYRITKDAHYREVIIQSAKTLATRFNPKTGVILSWDHSRDKWVNPVIIDNMMNLELLFEATKLTGDSSFYKIAVSHANTTMKNHFRPDFSSYHVVDYDPNTGAVLKKTTHQGYSDASAWARGQAWAVYGYTLCYRYTKNPAYLKQAENIAAYILNNPTMPADLVPFWDFNAPNIPNEPRDVSAAAVIASALYELSGYSANKNLYVVKADKMLNSISAKYISAPGTDKGFILSHSTGSKPSDSEVDVPLSYADYYYLEALLRCKNLKK
ncbi:glycoside hydrolase family 88 protein [Pedobacter sp. MC2016-24]|uniref:glycoside hydrolase family 88 protein n=1 Tax=Pedobacter sp. MC2016-24 TaxID=2780090 RepID=UPI001881F351|nr:glycoside hydrolase family 88 protein [Pedobacter sp. MC2016-24]MBE9600212.1 glycoside hydrolase family 88 protein [Pedobacter sp. MC2016-24]